MMHPLSRSTRTIAVASHCPEDLLTQQWTVDDFVLLRKLYEGQSGPARAGRALHCC